jgi:hypothetical protein
MARINMLSDQDWGKLTTAKEMIDAYQQEIKTFENGSWKKFKRVFSAVGTL